MLEIQLPGQTINAQIASNNLCFTTTPNDLAPLRLGRNVLDLSVVTPRGQVRLDRHFLSTEIPFQNSDIYLKAGLCNLGGIMIGATDREIYPQLDYRGVIASNNLSFDDRERCFEISGLPFTVKRVGRYNALVVPQDHLSPDQMGGITVGVLRTAGDVLRTGLTITSVEGHYNINFGVLGDTLEYISLGLLPGSIVV